MRQFQQGGVSDVQPIVPDVGTIPNLGNIDYPEVAPADLLTLLSLQKDQDTRLREQEAKALKEQQNLDNAQKVYYNLKDDMFGDYHSAYQGEVLANARKKYNVTDDLLNANDLFTIKSQTENLYKATTDPEVLHVLGEIENANQIRNSLPNTLTQDQKDAFAAEWQNYLNFRPTRPGERYDLTRLALASSNTPQPKAGSAKDFFGPTQRVATQLENVDLEDPDNKAVALKAVRNAWFLHDPDNAIEQKLIAVNSSGSPELTPQGEAVALDQLNAARMSSQADILSKINLDAAKKENTKRINPPKTHKSKEDEQADKEAEQVAKGWEVILSMAKTTGVYDQVVEIDPNTTPWLRAKLINLIQTDGGASLNSTKFRKEWIRDLMKLTPAPAVNSTDPFFSNDLGNQTPTVAPVKTSKGAFSQQMGSGN